MVFWVEMDGTILAQKEVYIPQNFYVFKVRMDGTISAKKRYTLIPHYCVCDKDGGTISAKKRYTSILLQCFGSRGIIPFQPKKGIPFYLAIVFWLKMDGTIAAKKRYTLLHRYRVLAQDGWYPFSPKEVYLMTLLLCLWLR